MNSSTGLNRDAAVRFAFILLGFFAAPAAAPAERESSVETVDVSEPAAIIERLRKWLPGEFEGAIAGNVSNTSIASARRLQHRIVRIEAPTLGEEVYYHEISIGTPEVMRIFQRKLYVMLRDEVSVKSRVRLLPVPKEPILDSKPLATQVVNELMQLDIDTLPSFPDGCEIHWSLDSKDVLLARVTPDRCRYFSAAFSTDIYPDMTYRVTINDFAMRDRLLDSAGNDRVPDAGLMSTPRGPSTTSEVLSMATDQDWRAPSAEDLLVMQLKSGRVIIELARVFAPQHVNNILHLSDQKWFDGLSINRVQDNFVVQWGDPDGTRSLANAASFLAPEFVRANSQDLHWNFLSDGDQYAKRVGWAEEFPAAIDPQTGAAWMTHCYGTVGVGRDIAADSGNGSELYVVIGHAPRQLDQNITVVGRVLAGIEHLSALPRGGGPLGFYERAEERVEIISIRQASQLAESERPRIEIMRTTRPVFDRFVETRRNRRDEWYLQPAGSIDLCAISIPTRTPQSP
jgi:peptidylprolyl isomerase